MKWERVEVKRKASDVPSPDRKHRGRKGGTAGPGRKWGHTCNAVKGGRQLYVIGGYGRDERQTNDAHVFDTVKETWSKPNVRGTPPTPRDSHTCTTVGNRLIIFGGTDGEKPLQDLYVLDTLSNTWFKEEAIGELPPAREGHCAAAIGSRIYVFGGCGKTPDGEDIYFNDVHVLDTETMYWRRVSTTGTPPAGRDSHSCCPWGTNLVVFGGEDCNNSYLSDIHLLDVDADTLVWKEMSVSGEVPPARAGHVAVAIGPHLVVFGGFTDDRQLFNDLHTLDLRSGQWEEHARGEGVPAPRFSLSADVVDEEEGQVLFFGGCNNSLEALDDMFYLHTGLGPRGDVTEAAPPPVSIKQELKRKSREAAAFQLDLPSGSPRRRGRPRKHPVPGEAPGLERMFEAHLTDLFSFGYLLSADVDGCHLEGVLFSYDTAFRAANEVRVQRRQKLKKIQLKEQRKAARAARLLAANGEPVEAPLVIAPEAAQEPLLEPKVDSGAAPAEFLPAPDSDCLLPDVVHRAEAAAMAAAEEDLFESATLNIPLESSGPLHS